MVKQTKTRKTPQQIAEERLGVAQRLVEKLEKKRDKAQADAQSAAAELTEAVRRRDFLAQDPALPQRDDDAAGDVVVAPCPECVAGKHPNCTGEVLVSDEDTAECPCKATGHPEAGVPIPAGIGG